MNRRLWLSVLLVAAGAVLLYAALRDEDGRPAEGAWGGACPDWPFEGSTAESYIAGHGGSEGARDVVRLRLTRSPKQDQALAAIDCIARRAGQGTAPTRR
ncbi:MAG: hypothetical protein HY521_10300 [Proteobacteria bacterium]|nr:hypothetical protein [Pseudomonadota bacterium]